MAFASPYSLCLILLFRLPVCVLAQTSQNITLGSSLTAALDKNDIWKSPSGDFAFGFQQIEAGVFLLAIWFDNIPEKTIIWSANGENLVQQGSTIQLTRDGRFRLNDTQGKQVWAAKLADSGTISYAAMLDSGNFVLASQDSTNLWESFDHPTDTILPTQILNIDSSLVARYSEMNYSSGRFLMQLQSNGNLVLSTVHFPLLLPNTNYWSTSTNGNGVQVIFDLSGSIYLKAEDESILSKITLIGASSSNFYQRAILEYDGVFRQYVYPKNDSVAEGRPMAWSSQSHVPDNICMNIKTQNTGSGACGFNSYCHLGNEQRPTCTCPPGYSPLDPNNEMMGCKQAFVPQECDEGQDADLFEIKELPRVNWWGGDYEYFKPVSEDWCRQRCLKDCFCTVAIYNTASECWMKKIPLSNGVQLNDGIVTKALVKIRKDNSTTSVANGLKQQRSTLNLILTVLFSSSAFLILVLSIATLWVVFRKRRITQPSGEIEGVSLRSLTCKELEGATNNFKEELGKGC